MIDKIQLTNFQAHKKSVLELTKGLNVITGQSDQGKSAIIHALYWLFFNKPSGTEFLNWDADNCSVEITVGSDTLARIRTKDTNSYKINEQKLDAVRSNVPDEIREIINITETNVQLQDDPYFLLSQNSSEVARILNQVVGITKIDSSLQYVNRIVNEQRATITFIKNEIKEKENKLKKYKEIKQIDELYLRYKRKLDEINKLEQKLDLIDDYKEQLQSFDSILEKEALIKDFAVQLNKLEQILAKKEKQRNKYNQLSKTIYAVNNEQKRLSNLETDLKRYEAQFTELKKKLKICPLCEQPFVN